MTLLELLRQELPKRGGWPEGAVKATSYGFVPGVHFWDDDELRVDCSDLTTRALGEGLVTREQYEATGWDGTGLPPVGVECEFMKHTLDTTPNWRRGIIKYISEYTVVIVEALSPGEFVAHPRTCNFRPLRTEAERAIDEIVRLSGVTIGAAKILYDAGYRK